MAKAAKQLTRMKVDLNWVEMVEEFINWKKLQGVSNFAIVDHRQAWKLFLQKYPDLDIEDMQTIKRAIMAFLQNRNAAYYNKLLASIKLLFEYMIEENLMPLQNPCKGLQYRKTSVRIVDHSPETIQALLAIPDKNSFVGYRDYTFMLFILDTGIRPHEAIQIKVADMEANGVWVREEVAKTRQPRFLPVSNIVLSAMKKLFKAKQELNRKNDFIFVTNAGKPLSIREMRDRFRFHVTQLDVHISAYHLRHYFALNFIRNGGNVFALQKMMGHTRITMTETYVNLAAADIEENHAKASPLAGLLGKRQIRK